MLKDDAHVLGGHESDLPGTRFFYVLKPVSGRSDATFLRNWQLRIVARALGDDLPFELGKGQEHIQDQAAHGGRGALRAKDAASPTAVGGSARGQVLWVWNLPVFPMPGPNKGTFIPASHRDGNIEIDIG
jgi:hypothetical protein